MWSGSVQVDGVNVPWLYLGMLFASFAWHNEDHFMYSINYMHHGEGKTWYGVPGSKATEFEKAMRSVVYDRAKEDKDLIYHVCSIQLAFECS
jgi:histone demethylase JARID1